MRTLYLSIVLAVALALNARAENVYIPVGGVAAGANNTLFRTDVRIFNPSAERTVGVSVHFLPMGISGANISGIVVPVGPRQTKVLNDIVGTMFNMPSGSIGAIRLDSDEEYDVDIIADSRTYTDSPNAAAPGTFGQYIPALELTAAHAKTVVLRVTNSADSTKGFRTNAGVMNPWYDDVTVTPRLFRGNGTLVAEGAAIPLPAKSMVQKSLAAMFGTVGDLDDGYITFEAALPVFSYASIVDNRSGDQIFVIGREDVAGVREIPIHQEQ